MGKEKIKIAKKKQGKNLWEPNGKNKRENGVKIKEKNGRNNYYLKNCRKRFKENGWKKLNKNFGKKSKVKKNFFVSKIGKLREKKIEIEIR